MITNDGKTLIAKYLLNQAPEFVSHIAVGIGENAISTSSSVVYSSSAKSLDFEAFRVPVLSKGLIKENGIEKLVFKAELPTDQRFRMTELGLYPAQSNTAAERYDSKTFISFTNSEPWNFVQFGSASVVPYRNSSLQVVEGNPEFSPGSIALGTGSAFFVNSDDSIFTYDDRIKRREAPRYLNKSLALAGGFSDLNSEFISGSAGYYLENSVISLDLGKNSPTDQIKLAFSLVSKSLDDYDNPDTGVKIRIEFINNTSGTPTAYVNMDIASSDFVDTEDALKMKRYQVVTKQLSDFTASADFSWSNINLVRVYAYVDDINPSDYFILLDGLRLENISTENPLYALVGAEYIKTEDGYAVVKQENSTSYIEYRFGLGVQ